ncbi:MAG TPA: hypothetical protein VKB38_23600 [Terracidiphilus sp.]|nr:hypothetical protein [Terracidiphilus sp.]
MLKPIVVLLAGFLIATDLLAATPNPYPNELKGLKFYARYLSPLRPLQSNQMEVEQVLGSKQGKELKDWKVVPLYSCKEDFLTCSHGPGNDPLDTIEITPKHRVSLRHVKFPKAFTVSYGSVSEINVACVTYTDAFGLQYWVVSGDFTSHKSGDLLMIEYGPAVQLNIQSADNRGSVWFVANLSLCRLFAHLPTPRNRC